MMRKHDVEGTGVQVKTGTVSAEHADYQTCAALTTAGNVSLYKVSPS